MSQQLAAIICLNYKCNAAPSTNNFGMAVVLAFLSFLPNILVATPPHSSHPRQLTQLEDRLVFTATTSQSGEEIWITDGSVTGTVQLRDIRPGLLSSEPKIVAQTGRFVYFIADSGSTERALWRTDGTLEQTTTVLPLDRNSKVLAAEVTTETLYLVHEIPTAGRWLLALQMADLSTTNITRSDGGKLLLPSKPELVAISDSIVFAATSATTQPTALWRTPADKNHSLAGNAIKLESHASRPRSLLAYRNWLFSAADLDKTVGALLSLELAESTTTTNVLSETSISLVTEPEDFTVCEGQLLFRGQSRAAGAELWRTSVDTSGTTLVKDIEPGSAGSDPQELTIDRSTCYFTALTGASRQLWKIDVGYYETSGSTWKKVEAKPLHLSDASGSSISPITVITTTTMLSDPRGTEAVGDITPFKSAVYFTATNPSSPTAGKALFSYDQLTGSVQQVPDTQALLSPAYLTVVGDSLYFTAFDSSVGRELWRLHAGRIELVKNIAWESGEQ